jgi:hypothetical protein
MGLAPIECLSHTLFFTVLLKLDNLHAGSPKPSLLAIRYSMASEILRTHPQIETPKGRGPRGL